MTTPATHADHSLLSASAAKVSIGLPNAAVVLPDAKSKWKGDFQGERKPANIAGLIPPPETPNSGYRYAWWGRDGIPAWLVSTIIHTLLLVLMVLIQVQTGRPDSRSILVSFTESNTDAEDFQQLPAEALDVSIGAGTTTESAVQTSTDTSAPSATITVDSPLVAAESKSTAAPEMISPLGTAGSDTKPAFQLPTGGLYRRDAQSRAELGKRYGATPESEDAVEAALKWLVAHQQRDGSWSFNLSLAPCNDRCRHSGDGNQAPTPTTAATGLALLAFLGAGYSQHEGIYADNVQRGLYYLREQASPTTMGLDLQNGSMYGHGIAMMAIGEAMGMTRYQAKTDADLFKLASGGAGFTMAAQHDQGGWRYVPGAPGDMTVTAWQVLSLISAQHGGVVLASPTLPRAERFIRSLSKPGVYAFGYQKSDAPESTSTAIGLCLLLYLGESPQTTPFANALDRMAQRGPKLKDLYHDYYATLALHHARHPDWAAWQTRVRDHLVKTQEKKDHEAGSWHFADPNGDIGGRLYSTAMAAMILEVYYRYLPLYQSRDEFILD